MPCLYPETSTTSWRTSEKSVVNCTRAVVDGHEPSQCGMCSPPGSHLTSFVVPSAVNALWRICGLATPVQRHELHWHVRDWPGG